VPEHRAKCEEHGSREASFTLPDLAHDALQVRVLHLQRLRYGQHGALHTGNQRGGEAPLKDGFCSGPGKRLGFLLVRGFS